MVSTAHPRAIDDTVLQYDDYDSSQSSAALASSPLTVGDDDHPDAKPAQAHNPTNATNKTNAKNKDTDTEDLGSLRNTLLALDQLRREEPVPPASLQSEYLKFTLSTAELSRFRQLLEPQLRSRCDLAEDLGLGLDFVERLHAWAQRRLQWEYDAPTLTVRMITPVHQEIVKALEKLLIDRFQAALASRGHRGDTKAMKGVEFRFQEPVPTFKQAHHTGRRALPTRSQARRERSPSTASSQDDKDSGHGEVRHEEGGHKEDGHVDVGHEDIAQDAGHGLVGQEAGPSEAGPSGAGPSEAGPSEAEPEGSIKVYGPDIGILYTPPQEAESYFPGFILEVGYSHPLEDWQAKRYIRYSNGHVRYVMAFNVDYDAARQQRGITIHAHQLAIAGDECFPEKCLDAYDVRGQVAASEDDGPVERDIGLRLSHLHYSLEDRPINLPMRTLVSLVEDAYRRQAMHDKYHSKVIPPPSPLRGKRFRTATPPEDDSVLLRDPDAGYAPCRPSSSKRRRL